MIIYKITNKINGKAYIGQTIRTLEDRWRAHNWAKNGCVGLKRAIDKYGKEGFTTEVLEIVNTLEELDSREMFWIASLGTLAPKGYNLKTGGNRSKYSEETKKRMSEAKGPDFVPWNKGLTKKDDIRIARQGSRGDKNPNLNKPGYWTGKKMPEGTGAKISKAKTGKPIGASEKYLVAIRQVTEKLKMVVFCHENFKTYESITAAEADLGLKSGNVSRVINGKQSHTKGYTFSKVLK